MKQRAENKNKKGEEDPEEGTGDAKLFDIGKKRNRERQHGGQRSFNRSFARKKK